MQEIVRDASKGLPVIVYDNDFEALFIAAELINAEVLDFMMKNCNEIRLAMPWKKIIELGLNKLKFYNGMIPIDSKEVSAEKRAELIKKISTGSFDFKDIKFPGKIFVEETKEMGVLERPGIAEACIDVVKMAGLKPVVVYAFMNGKRDLPYKSISVNELIVHRIRNEKIVERVVEATLPTKFYGTFKAFGYRTPLGEIVALVLGDLEEDVLVRIHSECLTGDVFHSLRCDCGEQLENSLKMIAREGKGVLIYMRGQEGRGIGLISKLIAYKLQEEGIDTVDANIRLGFPPDLRSYGIAAQILMDLGVKKVRLLTNNPLKIRELERFGFEVVREAIEIEPTVENFQYLKTKKEKMGHMLCLND
ncbi:MAG: GTP cyclohydrolase II [Archaeoglobaceae archaeon]|nr:GTP cyclohydrolase II [Archaeoglobaceae archaeon]MCX8151776.1 GTP cyclohydrolase II [Archaeoglobaceae archaeon]MDW8013199.1 GTP cyclohydrolase II [Archaeoglobaceae archaeon]